MMYILKVFHFLLYFHIFLALILLEFKIIYSIYIILFSSRYNQ